MIVNSGRLCISMEVVWFLVELCLLSLQGPIIVAHITSVNGHFCCHLKTCSIWKVRAGPADQCVDSAVCEIDPGSRVSEQELLSLCIGAI